MAMFRVSSSAPSLKSGRERLGLTGYVRNLLGEPAVEVQAEGERDKLETLLGYLKVGPPSARVATITTQWSEYTGSYSDFTVRY